MQTAQKTHSIAESVPPARAPNGAAGTTSTAAEPSELKPDRRASGEGEEIGEGHADPHVQHQPELAHRLRNAEAEIAELRVSLRALEQRTEEERAAMEQRLAQQVADQRIEMAAQITALRAELQLPSSPMQPQSPRAGAPQSPLARTSTRTIKPIGNKAPPLGYSAGDLL